MLITIDFFGDGDLITTVETVKALPEELKLPRVQDEEVTTQLIIVPQKPYIGPRVYKNS